MKHNPVYNCMYCGKFIKWSDFPEKAVHVMVTPSTVFTEETWETFHKSCEEESKLTPPKR